MTTLTRTVVAEQEGQNKIEGIRVGYTVYAVGEHFEVVVRNRRYDGVRVESQHDTQPIRLDATDRTMAIAEGRGHALSMIAFLRSLSTS